MIQSTSAMDRPVERRGLSRRSVLTAVAIAAVVITAVFAWRPVSRWMSAERSVELSRVRVGEVVRGDLQRDLSVQGRIAAALHPTTSSPVSGIVSLEVRAGEVVEQGQILAVVDSPELGSRLAQERSSLQSLNSDLERQRILAKQTILSNRQAIDLATVELDAARRGMQRAERSRAEGIINDIEYEQAQDEMQRTELALTHAREDAGLEKETLEFEVRNREREVDRQLLVVKELERQVERLNIRAPVAGLVSRLDADDHDAVTPGQSLVAVVDLSAFEIEVLIPESYADEIGHGTPALIGFGGGEYQGAVKSISPEVEGTQVRGIVEFIGETPQGLRQNQRVSTRLVLESKTDVLKVARGPFLENGGGRQAYLIRDDVAELHPIRVGASSVAEIEVLEGLEIGDRIIISDTTRFDDAEIVFLRR